MSHLRPIPTYTCQTCKKKATEEVINNQSSGIGFYCKRHAELALKEFNTGERDRQVVRRCSACGLLHHLGSCLKEQEDINARE